MKFRRFSSRLLLLIVGLVALAQYATYALVVGINHRNAVARINENLDLGAQLFERRVDDNLAYRSDAAALMSYDYAIRTLLLQDPLDRKTLRSALKSYALRMDVKIVMFLSPDGDLLADSTSGDKSSRVWVAPFQALVQKAALGEGEQTAKGFVCNEQEGLFALVVVPLYGPRPVVRAWVGLALPIDREFIDSLKRTTQLDVTILHGPPESRTLLVSTLPNGKTGWERGAGGILAVGGEPYVTAFQTVPLLAPGIATIALQRSLNEELAPARLLEWWLKILMPISLAIAALLALWVARSVSQPIQVLEAHTLLIAQGDYASRLNVGRTDELGNLAAAFNRMSEGLAERDKVRDLLDKNVSPEVAARLMRDGAKLGGEEREATILFVDLRGFTGICETLPPRDVVALLNRYLERMSAVVYANRGMVDKFIGDAIMAVFGLPEARPESADSALEAALGMEAALADLSAELAKEGRPRLSLGIGINTSLVVAGNLGSSSRLNYSVIGDGVNVASRLQALTRKPEYATNILVCSSTLKAAKGRYRTRSMGSVPVRGRAGLVEVFALDGLV
jgi:adenylate cyclase